MGQITPISIDTNLFIYYFENIAPWGNLVEALFQKRSEESPVIASTLLYTELLVAPMKQGRSDLVEVYSSLDQYIPFLSVVPFSREIALEAATLRATYNVKTPDAIHLATAIHAGSTHFYSADKRLPTMKEIEISTLPTAS